MGQRMSVSKYMYASEKKRETISDFAANNVSLNDFTIGLIFLIVAVVELTKIPLATAVYYSVRVFWRIVFLIALILVNVSTFETNLT